MRSFALWFVPLLLLASCERSAPSARKATNTSRLSGPVLEQIDAPPYSFLRLETDKGNLWVAVPITTIDRERPVTVTNGVSLKNFEARSIGKTFDVVVFGTLERG